MSPPEMSIKEILEKCSHLKIDEKRSVEDDYLELVISKSELSGLDKILTDSLGPAVKPIGINPSPEHVSLTKEFGGINSNQVLYKCDFVDKRIIAMLWPWGDGQHITVKIVIANKK